MPHLISVCGITIGRASDDSPCDVVLDDPRISRIHARIVYGSAGWMLVDQASRNTGFVNGAPFERNARTPLANSSVIRLGDTLLLFRIGLPGLWGKTECDAFPGRSPVAAAIRRQLRVLTDSCGHVLVLGETGTGKERVARALARPDAPFVVQNCAELTRELARSELFGHLRGAFTGAGSNRPGLIESADDGVLFLDEIGELALDVQGDLLRFLEDGTYRPVGSLELRRSRARVVAATNVDLDGAAQAGKFRRDLLARLRASNAPLKLPPLCERREDLPGWAHMFAIEKGVPATSLPADPAAMWTTGALECLLLHPWPDNLRELRGLVRSLIDNAHPHPDSADGKSGSNGSNGAAAEQLWPIAPEKLSFEMRNRRAILRNRRDGDLLPFQGEGSGPIPAQRPSMVDPSREEVMNVLAMARGNMRVAATLLGVDRRKLYRLCKSYGINVEDYRSKP